MTVAEIRTPSRLVPIALWVVRGLLALAFLAAGIAKLYGVPMLVEEFETIGFGQWFRYLTGILEVAGALTILMPAVSVFGALLLCCIMVGAIMVHVFVIGGSPVPAIVLLVLSAIVVVAQRRRLGALIDFDDR
jgi:putative oxidoreductase